MIHMLLFHIVSEYINRKTKTMLREKSIGIRLQYSPGILGWGIAFEGAHYRQEVKKVEEEADRQNAIEMIQRENKRNLGAVAEGIAKNHVIPFVGAGMSCPIYGTWAEYLCSILPVIDTDGRRHLERQLAEGRYEEAAQNIQDEYGIRFHDRTEEYFDRGKIRYAAVSPAMKLLPSLFQGPMVTTNLDRVIESVYAEEGIEVKTLFADDLRQAQALMRDGDVCLWKIHGDVEDRISWVITRDDYEKQYGKAGSGFLKFLEEFLQNRLLLFLGSSLNSDRIVSVLQEMCRYNPNIKHYAILPVKNGYRLNESDRKELLERIKQLGKMGVRPIWYPEGEYVMVAEHLKELIRISENIKKKSI